MSGEESTTERQSGYRVLASGIEWSFGESGGGSLSFDEIVAGGPTAILLFGVLAQLGAISRDLRNSSSASVAASHALVEVAGAFRLLLATRGEGDDPDKILDRATSVLTQLGERFPGMFPSPSNVGKGG
jgi:hypothetical protein